MRDKCIEMLTAALRMDGEWGGVVRGVWPQRGRKGDGGVLGEGSGCGHWKGLNF